MAETATITNKSAFEAQSLGKQVLFSIITFGLYTMYWTYKTSGQLSNGTSEDTTPILAIVPFLNLIAFWQISSAAEAVTDQSKAVLFICFLFVSPLSWYWVQSGINGVAQN